MGKGEQEEEKEVLIITEEGPPSFDRGQCMMGWAHYDLDRQPDHQTRTITARGIRD